MAIYTPKVSNLGGNTAKKKLRNQSGPRQELFPSSMKECMCRGEKKILPENLNKDIFTCCMSKY